MVISQHLARISFAVPKELVRKIEGLAKSTHVPQRLIAAIAVERLCAEIERAPTRAAVLEILSTPISGEE